MADVPFLPCTPFWPGEIVVARPDIPLVVEHVHEVDLDATLTLTPEAPGFAKISWAGMLFKDITGATLAPATKEVRIGANLVLSSPAAGIARLDATGGGGGSLTVFGGPGFGTFVAPCSVIALDASSGIKLTDGGGGEAVVALYPASPTQAGVVTSLAQTMRGIKTWQDGLVVGVPGQFSGSGGSFLFMIPTPDTGGVRPAFVMGDWAPDGLGSWVGSGIQFTVTDHRVSFSGQGLNATGTTGYNRTELAVRDEAGVEWVGEWVAPPGSTGPPWTFAGGLLVGSLGALAWLTSVTGSASGMGLSLSSSTSGGVITLTLGGTLNVAHGGTGASTQAGALNALLPPQGGHAGQFLTTDGANASWAAGGGGGGITSADSFDNLTLFG